MTWAQQILRLDRLAQFPLFNEQRLYEQRHSILVAIAAAFLLYRLLWVYALDPAEPKLIKPLIPIVGHALSIYKHGSRHFTWIAQKTGLPIYQIPVPSGKIAIAGTPEVLSSIDKSPRAVAFVPIAARVIERLSGLSPQGSKILLDKTVGEDRWEGYMYEVSKGVHATLSLGPDLKAITDRVAYDLNDSMRKFHGKKTRVNVLTWFRHEFGMSSTNGIYGPKNPFKDPKVEAGFWAFDDAITDLLVSRHFSPRGHSGRVDAWRGFIEYFKNGDHEQGSELVKVRHQVALRRGLSVEDTGKLEVTMIIGILTNTVPTIFWAVYYVYRDSALLEKLRQEIAPLAELSIDSETGSKTWTLPVSGLKERCPLLVATINETLRHRTCGISSRMVTEDVLLSDRYLLKKGTICELPNNVLHSNPAYWGSTVDEFDPTRFLLDAGSKEARRARGAFRPFGGGVSLCAGRHQAMSQMICALGLFAMGFDCSSTDGGEWKFPGAHGHTIAAAVDLPSSDLLVDVLPREGFEADYWQLDTAN
ncbi:cytochrome p450 [Hirsutella rhossiliensis]|uniref:Cytochrome p450 domain-containing protein n=1 Tax=Hirsutella rhossiliensis TaxID=111463 RepID=A0A9P8N8B5_9HYPO|nr:cytochrome p450 domain-containing protein [Hirsutella rhossiliensis]KAH0968822.1 cytochrome p450 domain-containing protein [Hirsutella rhossiliensis]